MAVATLSIDLEARLSRLEQDLGRASRTVEREAKKMDAAFAAASGKLKGLVGSLAAGVSVGFLTQLARSTIDGVDRLNDLADASGSTVEKISALEDVALRTGTSIDTVNTALIKFNAELAGAKGGSETALILEKIGLSADELRRLDPADALLKTSRALAQFADDGDKARIVQALFGKSVAEVAPFLKDLAEQTALVGTVTKEQTLEAEKFNKELFNLQKNALDAARELAGPLVTAINSVAETFRRGSKDGEDFFTTLGKLYDENSRKRSNIVRGFLGLDLLPGGDGQAANLNSAAGAGRGFVNPELVRPRIGGIPVAPSKPKAGPKAKAAASELFGPDLPNAYADALRRLENVDSQKLANLRDQVAFLTQPAAAGDARAREALAGIVEEIAKIDPEARKAAESAERLRDLLAGTDGALFKQQQSDLEFLQQSLEAGTISAEQYADAVRTLYQLVTEEGKAANEAAQELGFTFASAFEDALIGGEKLSNVLKSLEQDITRILLRRMVTEPLAGAVTSGVGLLTGGIKAGIGAFAGGGGASGAFDAFMSAFGSSPGKAGGGDVQAGRMYRINERGPGEVFNVGGSQFLLPGRNGSVSQNGGGGGRALNVTVNVQGAQGMSRDTAMQQGAMIGAQVQLALRRNG